jgi:hypothetical protein
LFLEGGGEKDVQDKSFNFKLYPKPYLLENLLMKRRSREINLNLTSICLEDHRGTQSQGLPWRKEVFGKLWWREERKRACGRREKEEENLCQLRERKNKEKCDILATNQINISFDAKLQLCPCLKRVKYDTDTFPALC